jgi:tetratricopeptide (TPR) repeat protein
MKKMIFSFLMLVSVTAMAQSDKYEAAMKKGFAAMDSAKTVMDWQNTAALFERIADAEKTQWLPYYYAGLAYSTIGWMNPGGDADANAEKIKALCDKAEAIEKNAEIYSLRNMAATQQMIVDPQSRWMTYGQEAAAALQKGLELDPNNPRLHYLQGMSVFGTPEQFGGGKAKAKPILEKAVELYKAEQPKPMYPHWGQKQAEDALAQCQ